MKACAMLAGAVFLAGCAASYEMPMAEVKAFAVAVPGSKERIHETAATVLTSRGYEIVTRNDDTRYLMTGIVEDVLEGEDCDCGRLDGEKALAVEGTHTRHMLEVQAREGAVTLSMGIDAWHISERADSSKVYCVSLGRREKLIASELIRRLATP